MPTATKSSSNTTKTVHVVGHWRHHEDGSKTYINQATRHVKK